MMKELALFVTLSGMILLIENTSRLVLAQAGG